MKADQNKTSSQNTGNKTNVDRVNFELTSLGILMSSFEQNGVHIANRDKYIELYFIELEQAYINGRTSAISEITEG